MDAVKVITDFKRLLAQNPDKHLYEVSCNDLNCTGVSCRGCPLDDEGMRNIQQALENIPMTHTKGASPEE